MMARLPQALVFPSEAKEARGLAFFFLTSPFVSRRDWHRVSFYT